MAYTAIDLQTAVKDDLHDSSFSSARILRYLNAGQRAIFNTHMFRFCETSVTGVLTVDEYTYEQQDDHEATIGGIITHPTSTSIYMQLDEYTYLPHREFFQQNPNPANSTSALPSQWTEFGDQLYFNVPADLAYTFTQRYFRIPTDMTADASVPDVPVAFRELLELYALHRSEKYRGNHDVAATYLQQFEDGLESMALRYGEVTQVASYQMPSSRVWTDA